MTLDTKAQRASPVSRTPCILPPINPEKAALSTDQETGRLEPPWTLPCVPLYLVNFNL